MPRRTRIPLVERPDEPGENPQDNAAYCRVRSRAVTTSLAMYVKAKMLTRTKTTLAIPALA